MAEQQESVPIFPGLEDPECVAEANKAQARMDEMKSNIYNLMIALLATHPSGETLAPLFLDDAEIAEDWLVEAKECVREHKEAYGIFINALSGRHP
jgi:hypothetical protein